MIVYGARSCGVNADDCKSSAAIQSDFKKGVELLVPKDKVRCAADVRRAMACVDDPLEQQAARFLGSYGANIAAIRRVKISIAKLTQPFRSEFENATHGNRNPPPHRDGVSRKQRKRHK